MSDYYDDVVVGAGSAGAPLAARLAEDPDRRVLLLEAGPDYRSVAETPAEMLGRSTSESSTTRDWGYRAETTPGRVIEYPAGRVTGGSSAINSGVALRGAPADYDEWAAMGNPGWTWSEVLPYFRKLESDHDFRGDYHGNAGPVPITRCAPDELIPVHAAVRDTALAMRFRYAPDLNKPGATGVGPWPRNVANGIRISTAAAYLPPAVRRRPNLTVRSGAPVRRVLLRNRRVAGVELADSEPARTASVTLCAGAIGSPGVLVRSGIGPADDVRAAGAEPVVELAGVGQNLSDHPFTWLSAIPAPGVCDLPARSVQIGLRYTSPGSEQPDDMQLLAILPVDLSSRRTLARRVGADRIIMIGAGLQRPLAHGRVRWSRRAPWIELRLGEHRHDIERMVDGLRLAWDIAHARGMAGQLQRIAGPDPEVLGDDRLMHRYLLEHLITFKHPTGTARMGPPGDPGAVVDAECLVHGVRGLRVADASIMPTIPRANTNLTCIMIGERVADLVRGRRAAPRAEAGSGARS